VVAVRGWRFALVGVAGLLAAAVATVLTVVANVATGSQARWFSWSGAVGRYPLWWIFGATVAVAGAGLLVWRVQSWYDQGLGERVPAVDRPEPWVMDRPDKVNQIVAALGREGTVGVTTAVQGAGGFGKTTIAKIAGADRRVLRRFKGRVHWVRLSRDIGKEGLAGLVNGLIAQLEPNRAVSFTDARQAGDYLAAVLARGPRRLLVLDDVWTLDFLARPAPFRSRGDRPLKGDLRVPRFRPRCKVDLDSRPGHVPRDAVGLYPCSSLLDIGKQLFGLLLGKTDVIVPGQPHIQPDHAEPEPELPVIGR